MGAILKIAIACTVWMIPYIVRGKSERIKDFCAGFCTAEAISKLCGRCAWTYSVVFGEITGFLMLGATAAGAILLFELLSGKHSGLLLTALYIFFSSADSEYMPLEKPIINASAEGMRLGCAGVSDAKGKGTAVLIACAAAGSVLGFLENRMPAAFSVIAACGLLSKGMKSISSDRYCIMGCVSACILAFL